MGNDHACPMVGIGIVRIKMFDGAVRDLTEVRYVPALRKNLISVGALVSKGLKVTMEDTTCRVTNGSLVIMKVARDRNLYYLKGSTVTGTLAASVGEDVEPTRLCHMRLGHTGEKSLKALARQGLHKGTTTCKLEFCEHCILGRKTTVKFGTAIYQTKGILDYEHTDAWGLTKAPSLGGIHYFVSFVDDYSRRNWVYSMKSKDEVLGVFVEWRKRL